MRDFDHLIERASCLAADNAVKHEALTASSIPFEFGPHKGRGVVLQRSAALELGAEGQSCGMIFSTQNTELVNDGMVSVCGKDIAELVRENDTQEPASAPFAQVIMVAGETIDPVDLPVLEDCLYAKDYISGYFVRSSDGRIHSRVSHKLAETGFSLKELGSAIIAMVKDACPSAERIEVIFATGSDEPFNEFVSLRSEWLTLMHDARKSRWLEKGVDIDCPAGGHCGQCSDRALCEKVRDIARLRKNER